MGCNLSVHSAHTIATIAEVKLQGIDLSHNFHINIYLFIYLFIYVLINSFINIESKQFSLLY